MGTVRDGLRPVQAQLEAYLQRLPIDVQAAALFGSRARGDHWEDSDIDLLVVSEAFEGLYSGQRIDLLLEPWPGSPALEPIGVTPAELLGRGSLLLWDALRDGLPLLDSGIFAQARTRFQQRIREGELTETRGGWQERLSTT